MLKIIANVLLFLFLTVNAYACGAVGLMMASGSSAAAASCDSCTGGVLFSAYFESTSDVTTGTPCGCSAGDTTGAANDSATIESGYINSADALKYFAWDVSSDDICKDTEGSVLIKYEYSTSLTLAQLFHLFGETNQNRLYIAMSSADDLTVVHEGADAGITTAATTGVATTSADTQYYVIARWITGAADKNLYIGIFDTSGNLRNSAGESTTDLTAFDVQAAANGLRIGNDTANEAGIKIHSIKIWDTYAGAALP